MCPASLACCVCSFCVLGVSGSVRASPVWLPSVRRAVGLGLCGCVRGCGPCVSAVCGRVSCVWGGVCACGCVRGCGGGHERRGPAVRAPPLLWVCVGGGVLLSHTLAGAVPSALAVLASGFGKGKSGRVPAAMAAAALAGPDPAPPGGGCGIRVSHSGHGSSCSPSRGPAGPTKERKGGCVGSVGPLVPVGSTPLRGVHLRSINPVVFGGPSHTQTCGGELVLKRASRLDAFSGYPSRT